jgi:hypothetical protein
VANFLGHIFLTVDCWQQGFNYSSYSLYVSTQATALWKYTPLTSLEKYEFLPTLLNSAYLETYTGTLRVTQK